MCVSSACVILHVLCMPIGTHTHYAHYAVYIVTSLSSLSDPRLNIISRLNVVVLDIKRLHSWRKLLHV